MKKGFSTSLYIKKQRKEILNRINKFDKLYLEFGGKLCYDLHASRVLPGYEPTSKIKIIKSLPKFEIIYCINAKDIENERQIGDFKLSYKDQALKDLKDLRSFNLHVSYMVITRFSGEPKAIKFAKAINKKGIKTYFHAEVKGYPHNLQKVIEGFEKQPYIPTKGKITIVTGTSSGSGKMSVALSQIYHERKKGVMSGFAKNETFPIWNLPINHPINIAYEAATADLQDKNMKDPYSKTPSVNYNRDIENFAILKKIASKITHEKNAFGYRSPTEMGINKAREGIINEKICIEAARNEILRRYDEYLSNYKKGKESKKTIKRMDEILKKASLHKNI